MKNKFFKSDLDEVIMKLYLFYKGYNAECNDEKIYISTKKCPRCGVNHLPGDVAMASTSKLSPEDMLFYICGDCALPDKMSHKIEDFLEWAIVSDDFDF